MVSQYPTPLLGQFLIHINGFVKVRNPSGLADYVALEPPFANQYMNMIEELRKAYPAGKETGLDERCSSILTAAREEEDGTSWTAFISFMVTYLEYLRDVSADPNKYLQTYSLLSELQQRANSALGHDSLGHLMLPIAIANAKIVCRLAIGLDKQSELIAHLKSNGAGGGDDGGARETLPERAANILRTAFVTCLNDRTAGLDSSGSPEGRKRGIYIIANLCLKILFQCGKTRNAAQIFENIYNTSPPLSAYPKTERVTYLYYLGRYLFQNSHFYRAQVVLQQAYGESPTRPDCVRQRRQILVYLLASNIILGRFPSSSLLTRPEAQGLGEHFLPLCHAIRKGDLAAFRAHVDYRSPHAPWFLHFRILLQLRHRGEVLVWRSLVRKTWLLNGILPAANSKSAPLINLRDILTVFEHFERRLAVLLPTKTYTDPDYVGLEHIENDPESLTEEQKLSGIESKLSALIDQGLVGGYIAHTRGKFAILGAKAKGGDVLAAGFPQPWAVLKEKADDYAGGEGAGDDVPGWKKASTGGFSSTPFGGGMVVNLSGARPVGVFS